MFPKRVRRMVLDSNVDPRKVWYQANLDQDVAFDRVINIWFGWIARHDDVYDLGSTRAAVRRLFHAEQQRLRREPAGGPGDDNLYAVYLAVECTDAPRPRNWNRWRRDNWRLHFRYPFFTWVNAWFNAPCAFWHAPPGKPVKVDGRKVPAILLLGETLDAATPFSGGLEVRRRYPRASLIATPGGTTHATPWAATPASTTRSLPSYLPRRNGRA